VNCELASLTTATKKIQAEQCLLVSIVVVSISRFYHDQAVPGNFLDAARRAGNHFCLTRTDALVFDTEHSTMKGAMHGPLAGA
jgi:hypothetical protein